MAGYPALNIIPFAFAGTMAGLDSLMLSLIKYISLNKQNVYWLILPMIVYALQPILFYYSMNYETLTVMNLLFDLMSDIIITFIGLVIFKETIGPYKKLGVIFSFFSIILMSLNDGY